MDGHFAVDLALLVLLIYLAYRHMKLEAYVYAWTRPKADND